MTSPLRILYASRRPPYPFFLGGAARCAHRLLLSLARDCAVDCLAVGSADYAPTTWSAPTPADREALGVRTSVDAAHAAHTPTAALQLDCGYPVAVLPDFETALADTIRRFRPDIVWAQLEGAFDVLSIARRHGVQGLLFVHDAEDDEALLRRTADLGCHVVCSSEFLAGKVSGIIGRPSPVIYPASDWYFGTGHDPEGFITMVNPHPVKGLETFLQIARRLPQHRFLLQESWNLGDAPLEQLHTQLESLPHVRFQRRVADMRSVYARTRLLLVPSIWQEGFGMVAVEAQSCGIPVIASARGGLRESVGRGGLLIEDYRNVDAWTKAIASVVDDESSRRRWSDRALAHARRAEFAPAALARRLLDVCGSTPARYGLVAQGMHALGRGLQRLPGLGRLTGGFRR